MQFVQVQLIAISKKKIAEIKNWKVTEWQNRIKRF